MHHKPQAEPLQQTWAIYCVFCTPTTASLYFRTYMHLSHLSPKAQVETALVVLVPPVVPVPDSIGN